MPAAAYILNGEEWWKTLAACANRAGSTYIPQRPFVPARTLISKGAKGGANGNPFATVLLLRWRYISADEEDHVGALIDKKEKKGLVDTEYERRRWGRDSAPGYHYIHDYSS